MRGDRINNEASFNGPLKGAFTESTLTLQWNTCQVIVLTLMFVALTRNPSFRSHMHWLSWSAPQNNRCQITVYAEVTVKKRIWISIELTTIIIIAIINVHVCKNYYSNICFFYILHTVYIYIHFILWFLSTAVPCSCWPSTSNRPGSHITFVIGWWAPPLFRTWASSTLGAETPSHVTSHTQPLGRRRGDPFGGESRNAGELKS